LSSCLEVVSPNLHNDDGQRYVLMQLHEGCRADSSCYNLLVKQAPNNLVDNISQLLKRANLDEYVANKAAYLLTAIMSHGGSFQYQGDLDKVMGALFDGAKLSEQGVVDAVANLLKCDQFRKTVWDEQKAKSAIFKNSGSASVTYKQLYCIWLLSFNEEILNHMAKENRVPEKLKGVMGTSRVEKVIRIGLLATRNVMKSKSISDELVECGLLEVLQQLEFEKWRDTDLYDEIREMCTLVATRTAELTNFARYEKELATGELNWSFIHSDKFWNENAKNFEKDGFSAIVKLHALLKSSNTTTIAVACHDIGEFCQRHPIGKRIINKFGAKQSVMEHMSSPNREVAREALLCVQKIMLSDKSMDMMDDGS